MTVKQFNYILLCINVSIDPFFLEHLILWHYDLWKKTKCLQRYHFTSIGLDVMVTFTTYLDLNRLADGQLACTLADLSQISATEAVCWLCQVLNVNVLHSNHTPNSILMWQRLRLGGGATFSRQCWETEYRMVQCAGHDTPLITFIIATARCQQPGQWHAGNKT